MEIENELKSLKEYGFTQKDAVENILEKNFSINDIQLNIEKFYPKPGNISESIAFILSIIGQILLIIFEAVKYSAERGTIDLAIIFVLISASLGFLFHNKACIGLWIGFFIMAAIYFLMIFFKLGVGIFFPFATLASLLGRLTYIVYSKKEYLENYYDFSQSNN